MVGEPQRRFEPSAPLMSMAKCCEPSASSAKDFLISPSEDISCSSASSVTSPQDENGDPVYGPRDEVDLDRIRSLGLPFYLAGGFSGPNALKEALNLGAQGIQVGSVFALSKESNLEEKWKQAILDRSAKSELEVLTDGKASPTGFPFKVAQLPGTVSDPETFLERERRCDVGCLRKPYEKSPGEIAYRCPAEPAEDFLRKGGDLEEAKEARCLCNGLLSNVGLAQVWNGIDEPSILTLGQGALPQEIFDQFEGEVSAGEIIEALMA